MTAGSARSALAIATDGVRKRYGRVRALDGLDLRVPSGAVYVLVGPNGAGKTTALRILLDLTRADEGGAWVLGMDTVREGATVRANVGYVPERHDAGYGGLRVRDLLHHHASYHTAWDAAYAAELTRFFAVRPEQKFGKLSKGQARRVQLIMALAHHPPVLLLDEPTDGLDPVMREQTLSALSEHVARFPTSVLISTHLVHEVEGLGDHLGVLHEGRLRVQVGRDELRRKVRRYRLEVPDAWTGAPGLNGSVLRRAGTGREHAWIVWGEEAEVRASLSAAGAQVRATELVTLQEAAIALLANPTAELHTEAGSPHAEVGR